MNTIITKNAQELAEKAADWITEIVSETLKKQDRFTIVLSGGSTPKLLHNLLASERYRDRIDWSKMHFFWGDERFVPFEDERNNARMAFETLLDKVPVNKKNIHVMQTTGPEPEESAADYEKMLRNYFEGQANSFDLVLLGLGNDAHTLSLFPGYPVVFENQRWVSAFYLEQQKMYRITLTAPVVNRASHVAFLVSGGDKAAALFHVLAGEHDPALYPAQIIQPFQGEAKWFIDEAAAADL